MDSRRRRGTTVLVAAALPVLMAVGVAACGGDDDDADAALSPQAAEGRTIVTRSGCAACHGADGEGGIGPAWSDSLGTAITLEDGTTVTVDEAYLSRSIVDPRAQIHEGFTVTMPENQLSDDEIAAVVAYIVALNGSATTDAAG